MNLRGILPFAHDTLRKVVRPGDYVIDATCGNGHDTLLLAELVGINGHVLGFDIQQMAVDATKARLENAGVSSQVELVCASHARILRTHPDLFAPLFLILDIYQVATKKLQQPLIRR